MFTIKKRETFSRNFFKVKFNKPKIYYHKKTYYLQKFFFREIGFCFEENFKILKNWHSTQFVNNWILNKFLSINFFHKYEAIINQKIFFLFLRFLKPKKIFMSENDIAILGPWPGTYFHQITDFIFRLIYISIEYKKFNKVIRIFLPKKLKNILNKHPYRKIFEKFKIIYLDKDYYLIENFRYMPLLNYQKKNFLIKKVLIHLKKKIFSKKIDKKKLNIIISRKKSQRKILNEVELVKKLKKYNFKLYCFEDLSFSKQIDLCIKSKIIIGYQGSGLINSIFMNKGSSLIDITNKYIDNNIYRNLISQLGIRYFKSKCYKSYRNLNGICNIIDIENKVKQIINKS